MKTRDGRVAVQRRRAIWCVLSLLGVAGSAWIWSQTSDYPGWYIAMVLSLVTANLLNWVLEPSHRVEHLACKRCGRKRDVRLQTRCPNCGGKELRMPWLNRFAFGLIVAFLAVLGGSFIWEGAHAAGTMICLLAAVVVAEIAGFKLSMQLNRAFGGFFPYRFERDVQRLRWQRHLAIRAILLVGSLAIFSSALLFLLRGT